MCTGLGILPIFSTINLFLLNSISQYILNRNKQSVYAAHHACTHTSLPNIFSNHYVNSIASFKYLRDYRSKIRRAQPPSSHWGTFYFSGCHLVAAIGSDEKNNSVPSKVLSLNHRCLTPRVLCR